MSVTEQQKKIGVLPHGVSLQPVYELASRVVKGWQLERSAKIVDIGGGSGAFSKHLLTDFDDVTLVDYEPQGKDISCKVVHSDLNAIWQLEDNYFDALASLEVVEHLENPRHFCREIMRILKPGGVALVTTPNQSSLSSKISLLLKGQFRDFRGASYPAHITALLQDDIEKILEEVGAKDVKFSFTNDARIPFSSKRYQAFLPLKGELFSDNIAVSFRKPR